MGTRAVISFIDEDNTFHVYKHWDGNPESILSCIEGAKLFAWELPRFEADEFAAAFIAACKPKGGGDVRLIKTYKGMVDLEFRYEVRMHNGALEVTVLSPIFSGKDRWKWVKFVPEVEAAA